MNPNMSAVSFSATSLKFDLSMDARMGRKMVGLFGDGGLEIRPDGLTFQGRRHHYATNLIGGAVTAAVVIALLIVFGDAGTQRNATGFGMFAFVFGSWLTSIAGRFRSPETVQVERASIERVMFNAVLVRVCTRDGDVQLSTDPSTYGRLLQALQSWGIPAQKP